MLTLCSLGSFKEGNRAVSRWRGSVDRAGSDPGADWHPGGAVCLRHSDSHPAREGAGWRSPWDPEQSGSSSLQTGQPGRGKGSNNIHESSYCTMSWNSYSYQQIHWLVSNKECGMLMRHSTMWYLKIMKHTKCSIFSTSSQAISRLGSCLFSCRNIF